MTAATPYAYREGQEAMIDGLFSDPLHLIILLVVVLIIFGPGKLPSVGAALGKSVKEFKKATLEENTPKAESAPVSGGPVALVSGAVAAEPAAAVPAALCSACGTESDGSARFCGGCGASLVKEAEPVMVDATPRSLICTNCNTENPGSNRFCARCGRVLEPSLSHA